MSLWANRPIQARYLSSQVGSRKGNSPQRHRGKKEGRNISHGLARMKTEDFGDIGHRISQKTQKSAMKTITWEIPPSALASSTAALSTSSQYSPDLSFELRLSQSWWVGLRDSPSLSREVSWLLCGGTWSCNLSVEKPLSKMAGWGMIVGYLAYRVINQEI